MKTRRLLSAGLATAAAFIFVFLSLSLAQDFIVIRRKLMESNNSVAGGTINKAMQARDFTEIQAQVKVILGNMDKILALFPEGSVSEKSRAKPEIWDRWAEFRELPSKVKKAAQDLSDAAKSGDEAEVQAKFKALGEACKNCHESFRAPKLKQNPSSEAEGHEGGYY